MLLLRDLIAVVQERKSRKWYFSNVKDYEVDQLKKGLEVNSEEVRVKKLTEGMKASYEKCVRYAKTKATLKHHAKSLTYYDEFLTDYDWIFGSILSQFSAQNQILNKPSATVLLFQCRVNTAVVNLLHR